MHNTQGHFAKHNILESRELAVAIKEMGEAAAKQRDLIAKTNGVFAEVGHCGEDGLACGVCDECEEEIG